MNESRYRKLLLPKIGPFLQVICARYISHDRVTKEKQTYDLAWILLS